MKGFLCFILFSISSFLVFSQTQSAGLFAQGEIRSSEEGFAAQEFRRGVQAYYRGSYNEAVLQFEKALNYMPQDNLIMDWLSKSYYHTGLEGTAIDSWTKISENGYGGLLLQNKIEIIRERRVAALTSDMEVRYTESGSYPGNYNGNMIFSGPVSVLPNNNGTIWVLSYGSNELVEININGQVVSRVTGPINGFDRPIDIIRLHNGNLLVSESAGDRLALFSKKGRFIKYFGSKGRGIGQVIGPQFLAEDSRNNIYVSDYGNSRVSVFDKDGNGLFSFGSAQNDFNGLRGPTGIAVLNDSVFVVDDILGAVYEFDLSGNYKGTLVEEKTFYKPESMKVWEDFLVVCDSNKVISIDSNTGSTFENIKTGNAPSRLTCAVPDVNGNVIVTDVKTNEVYVMSRMQELIGGLFVQIERVNASKFPLVTVDLRIENRHRAPIVGLRENNFYLTENRRPVNELKFLGSSSQNEDCDITLIIDRSVYAKDFEDKMTEVVRELALAMNGRGTLRIISAGNIPSLEYSGSSTGAENFSVEGLRTAYSNTVPLDLALRLGVNDLINAAKKRAIIIISGGRVTLDAFDHYSLAEMAAFINNNHVYVGSVLLDNVTADEELSFIVNQTPLGEYYIYRSEGLSGIVDDIIDIPSGLYTFSYKSALSTNFGEKYLPLETEVYLMNRSGRDETGYFAPLQ